MEEEGCTNSGWKPTLRGWFFFILLGLTTPCLACVECCTPVYPILFSEHLMPVVCAISKQARGDGAGVSGQDVGSKQAEGKCTRYLGEES